MNKQTTPPVSVTRVCTALEQVGITAAIKHHKQSTRTAEEAAQACGCDVGEIVKTLVFTGKQTGEAIMLLVAGDQRVHEKRAGRAIGEAIGRADADFVRQATGFAIGGVSPFGHPEPLRIFADETLMRFELLWAAAGTPNHVFSISPDELVRGTDATIIPLI